jgi:glycosyltransferase involved in cell wall biosynthesis
LNAPFQDKEIIGVDNCSTDGTREILKEKTDSDLNWKSRQKLPRPNAGYRRLVFLITAGLMKKARKQTGKTVFGRFTVSLNTTC